MSNYPVNTLSGVIAASGDKRIPPDTAAAAGLGRLSQEKGFGQTNSKPLEQGGIPPFREDFNGIFNLFSQFLLWYQQGGIMKYNAGLDYEVGNEVIYSGNKYRCIQNNGPATTVKAPSDTAYWEKLVNTPGAVLYDQAQSLSAAQKQQARDNIGAISSVPSIDAVLYDTVQALTATQKQTARDNIGAVSSATFNSDALGSGTLTGNAIRLNDQAGNVKSTLNFKNFPTMFGKDTPATATILWSGDLDEGDITLNNAFTDFEALMFVYSCTDNSPGTGGWNYSIIPVWILKKVIIDNNLFGVTNMATFDLTNNFSTRWEIIPNDSTATLLKHNYNYHVHMWRIVGLKWYTN